ncbi:hypothetical protein [Clostridium sp.]|uniref:hypothetical protein n=1 Tax=Clostridium sp. TaxID=1506 RepID=UPI00261F7046|nr:hypothetical protein [uncultured Clostridium sp.]
MNILIDRTGIFKREIAKLELKDSRMSYVIIEALIKNGYDIVSNPLSDNAMDNCGEVITVYIEEKREY